MFMFKVSKILVPVDFSSCSRAALSHALSLAGQSGATIDVLYVVEVPSFKAEPRVANEKGTTTLREYALEAGRAELADFLSTLESHQRSKLTTTVEVGRPRESILEHAKRHDLVVIGTHGRTGRAHSFAGSVAENVVRMAPCPVLTVRAD
jgi:nucleotide-binding universal stress UspA family protein